MTKDDMTYTYFNDFSGDDAAEILIALGFTPEKVDEALDPVLPQNEGQPSTTVQANDLLLLVPLTELEGAEVDTLIEWGKEEVDAIADAMRRRPIQCPAWSAFFTTFKKQPEARLLLDKAGFGANKIDQIVEANS